MTIKILLPLLSGLIFFAGCGNDVRPDGYVSQPSVLLTKYNISHMRLHVNSSENAVITFSNSAFTYDSGSVHYEGSWSSTELPTIIGNNEQMTIVNTIDYTTTEGYSFTTNFFSTGFELEIGDTFILSGDQLLSGSVTQIELNNF
jgi:hypothetical protein